MTLVLDDVVHYEEHGGLFHLETYYDIINQNDLGYISPALKGSSWSQQLGPKPVNESIHQVGREMHMIELQATTFRPDYWRCMYELLDTEVPSGWGVDLWFYDYCIKNGRLHGGRMAIIDTMYIQHNPFNLPSTHVGDDINRQVQLYKQFKGVELRETYPHEEYGLIYYDPKK
jgi:hypothetical protein